jgi:hypothetical protein
MISRKEKIGFYLRNFSPPIIIIIFAGLPKAPPKRKRGAHLFFFATLRFLRFRDLHWEWTKKRENFLLLEVQFNFSDLFSLAPSSKLKTSIFFFGILGRCFLDWRYYRKRGQRGRRIFLTRFSALKTSATIFALPCMRARRKRQLKLSNIFPDT